MAAQPHLHGPHARSSTAAPRPARPYFPLKSQWADAQAQAVREQLRELDATVVAPGDWRASYRLGQTRTQLLQQESEWTRRAASYRLQERRAG